MSSTDCKNCNRPLAGNFCSNCGQPSKVHRIDVRYFLHDIPHSLLHVDKGFPYTFGRLITRPSKALQGYLEGKRVNFFRPLGYVVLMSAISSLIINQIRSLIEYVNFKRTGVTIIRHQSFFSHY